MKIFCIGRNYVAHAKELNNKVPTKPLVFMKPNTALTDKTRIPYPAFTKNLHYELEVVLLLTKGGKNISKSKALGHIGGIALGVDYTARDVQAACKEKGHPWEIAKGFDNSASLSAFYHPKDFNLKNLKFEMSKNGMTVQSGSTSRLIFPFEVVIQYLSTIFTLEAGDLIYTGTPAGVGPVKPGDELKGYLEGRMVLENYIIGK